MKQLALIVVMLGLGGIAGVLHDQFTDAPEPLRERGDFAAPAVPIAQPSTTPEIGFVVAHEEAVSSDESAIEPPEPPLTLERPTMPTVKPKHVPRMVGPDGAPIVRRN